MIEKRSDAEPPPEAATWQENGTVTEALEGAPGSSSGEPSPESLRRTSSKIANLRAAFEKQQDTNGGLSPSEIPFRRFDRVSSGNQSQDAEMARLKEQFDAATKLAEQQGDQIKDLRGQLKEEVSLRQAFEGRCPRLEEQIVELKAALTEKDHTWQAALDRQAIESSNEKSRLQEEASKTQTQLLELKRTIATNTRIESQVSDASIAEQMQFLYHETQNWIVAHFRKTEKTPQEMHAKLISIAEPKLLTLKPVFESATSATRLAALQTVTVCYLMEIFQDPLLFGLPIQQRHVKKAAEALPSILPFEAFNRWRSVTAEVIRSSESVPESVESASKSMSEIICITLNTLTDCEESQARIEALNTIVKKIVSLAHLCKVQRARYDFDLPAASSPFLPHSMENFAAESDQEPHLVQFATFPSVRKVGDESGSNMHITNVVAKAKVLCGDRAP